MKYIRTKDGIEKIEKSYSQDSKLFIFETNKGQSITCIKDKILKITDTIEELCDEFVVMSGYSLRHYQFKTLRNAIKHSKLYPFEVMYIYGAIWTDKGLIYVAKMNEKGELELL